MSRFWLRTRRFLTRNVLHTDDSAHAIALGAAIATFVAILPCIGLHTVLAIGLAALFRANKAICVPVVWITNPVTGIPIYAACYALGRAMLASSGTNKASMVLAELQAPGEIGWLDARYWTHLLYQLASIGLELWVGCIVVGAVAAIAAYFGIRRAVTVYRARHRQRLERVRLGRPALQPAKLVHPAE